MSTKVVGVDFGRDSLRGVEVVDPGSARPKVVRYHEIALPEGAVRSGEVRELHTVASSLKRLWAEGGFSTKRVVLGMGNQRVLARELTVPKLSAKQIKDSLPFQVQDLLPVPVADAILDFYPVSEGVSENGPVVHGLLIAALKEAVLANVTAVRLAKLEPVEVDLIPFALTRLLTTRDDPETVALIDVGGTTTTVVIATGGVPGFVRIIPAGGDDLTAALASRLQVTLDEAEQLKRTVGMPANPADAEEHRIAEASYASVGELLVGLRNTLTYFVSQHPQSPISRIVLTGRGARMPGIPDALHELSRIPVVSAEPLARVELHKFTPSAEQTAGMTVALGLALGSAA
ncbi:type IV pilus assembly protein PilM [Diaminobutyricimonas aerilata]|uniref:Type IV pilus assembly protein PilM n=1 Tax=Diaminobutyricimonas aerilata TaxID=1162967 RepID=A0A2M9CMY1_9MICO|nr:type IV pilus assembly protein PilM [Diaminobutyricimonas aerilata]PJJ73245.1 type IV pilus assembly protein PilM [Diaminobutyricimonas aerilata]